MFVHDASRFKHYLGEKKKKRAYLEIVAELLALFAVLTGNPSMTSAYE